MSNTQLSHFKKTLFDFKHDLLIMFPGLKEKLEKYQGGLKEMQKLPDIVIIIGQNEEINAVLECKKLGLRSITILDTDCDPSLADLFIPANDDSVSSIKLILNEICTAIQIGREKMKINMKEN